MNGPSNKLDLRNENSRSEDVMWTTGTDNGIPDRATAASLAPSWPEDEVIKLKVDITETLIVKAEDFIADKHEELSEEWDDQGINVVTSGQQFVYLYINRETGDMVVVGAAGHPLDKTRNL